jgi:hypothetical protein
MFLSAEILDVTDSSKIILSYSNDLAYNYEPKVGRWEDIHKVLSSGLEWCNHHFIDNHRTEENAIEGFNLIVVDVDGGIQLELASSLMSQYKFVAHHTKRSTDDANRFRMIFLMDKTLKLNEVDFKAFMKNFMAWIPVEVDEATGQRSRKWSTVKGGDVFYNDGFMINALDFMPETSRSQDMNKKLINMSNLDGLERWFMLNASEGSRNHLLLRLGLALVDGGMNYQEIEDRLYSLNDKLDNPLSTTEIRTTILKTVTKKLEER